MAKGKRTQQSWVGKAREAAAEEAAKAEDAAEQVKEARVAKAGPNASALERVMEELELLELAGAATLVAYCQLRDDDEDPVQVGKLLKSQPWVWSAVRDSDYVRLANALDLCGLPSVDPRQLQREVSLVLDPPKPRAPTPVAGEASPSAVAT